MPPTPEARRRALLKLLALASGPSFKADQEGQSVRAQIDGCIERTKAEASEGAALVDACAPHGSAMLTQAQQRLENLEALKLLECISSENLR